MSRAGTHQQTLTELTELAMEIARTLEARTDAAVGKSFTGIVSAFIKTALVVRRCILLSAWLDQNCPSPKLRSSAVAAPSTPTRPGDAIPAERSERVERVDFGPDPQAALEDGRFARAIDDLKAILTLEPGLDPSPAAIATRLIAAGPTSRPTPRPDG